jgi:release factor glutamine methyltransferase
MTTAEAVALTAARLAAVGIEDARREARLLLAAALGTDAAGLLATDEIDAAAVEPLLRRREAREPMAYILGKREFWGLTFATSAATLIPRPDSETLIESALAALPRRDGVARILDLGTGTGCLLLAALSEFPSAFGVGVDLSPAACALANANAASLGLAARAAFAAGNWAAALNGRFDLVFSNPPYIPAAEIPRLMPEVSCYEPKAALDGGADGLDAYRAILAALRGLLSARGVAVLEVGAGQAEAVMKLAWRVGLGAEPHKDLAGHQRAITLMAK